MTKESPSQDDQGKPVREPAQSPPSAGPTFAEPVESQADLSSEIVKALPRSVGDRVTCRRINGNLYRCNWWAPQDTQKYDNPTMTGLVVTTHRVRKSQVLHVTKVAKNLVIK